MLAVIIEDDQEMGTFFQTVLADQGIQSEHATTGVAGIKLVELVQPNLVLLDLHLPDIQGLSVCEKIKSMFPEMVVIMITAEGSARSAVQGFANGADDYIPKPVDTNELIARIKARFKSAHSRQQARLTFATIELNQDSHQVVASDQEINLSAQEFKLLEYFLENPEKVLSREMILARIWDNSPDIETRVVDVYVGYLRKKIPQLKKYLHSIRGFGYILKK